ncbi:glycosyltransferase, partial [Streptomyces klenkii]|uniref:glycosyltransferase n=1 Tax=Streptomyces klenkii TaxID=1420899 RepID=UPI0033B2F056
MVYATWPARPELGLLAGTDLFARTMYESSEIPPHWAAQLNHARAVIVASHYVADVFQACGVTAPIYVVPDGVDPDIYPYQERPSRAGLTTLMVGMMQPRKNYREGVAAWQEAFDDVPDARLIIKSKQGWTDGFVSDDPRIQIDTSSEPTQGIIHWYKQADVLMALGSEGFGIPLIEGMATGLPVIALDAMGQADVCSEAGDLVLSVKPSAWRSHWHYGTTNVCGEVPVPGVADIVAKLRWVTQHHDEAVDLGRAASSWVHRNRNVWNYGPDVLAVVEEHTGTRRPVRHRGFPTIDRPLRRARQPARSSLARSGNSVRRGTLLQDDDNSKRPPLWSFRLAGNSSLGIVTLWTPQIEKWAWQHAADKRSYCEQHGFSFYGYGDVLEPSRAATWSKIPALQRHLSDHEWLLWTDADAAIVNFEFD